LSAVCPVGAVATIEEIVFASIRLERRSTLPIPCTGPVVRARGGTALEAF